MKDENMIFDKKNLKLYILEAAEFHYGNGIYHNKNRHYSALSLRTDSNAVIMWNGKTVSVSDKSLTYFPPNVDYTRKCSHDNMIVIHFDVQNYISYDIQSIIPDNYDAILDSFEQILNVWNQKREGYLYAANALLYNLFEQIATSYTYELNDSLKSVLDYIHSNYTCSDLRIETLAKIINVSEVYLRKMFREQFGCSPKKYIIDLRLEHAKTLLNMESITVSEVCERSGFNDVKYFSALFRKKMGYPPSKQKYTNN